MALTRQDLDPAQCANHDECKGTHGDLVFHGRCHPRAGTRARYLKEYGTIEISCHKCQKLICHVLVAKDDEEEPEAGVVGVLP